MPALHQIGRVGIDGRSGSRGGGGVGRGEGAARSATDEDTAAGLVRGRGDGTQAAGGVCVEAGAQGVVDRVDRDGAEEAGAGLGGQDGEAVTFEPDADLVRRVVAEELAADAPIGLGEVPDVARSGAGHAGSSGLARASRIDDRLT
jgi:hypothetical protein